VASTARCDDLVHAGGAVSSEVRPLWPLSEWATVQPAWRRAASWRLRRLLTALGDGHCDRQGAGHVAVGVEHAE
jgi:hypothetical protein